MRKTITSIFIFLVVFVVNHSFVYAQNKKEKIDIVAEISKNPELVKKIGLYKLYEKEKKSLNELLNNILDIGLNASKSNESINKDSQYKSKAKSRKSVKRNSNVAYKSKIDSDNNDVLKLDNGAIVEITSGYLGYIGYRKNAVIYKIGNKWKIWIEGKRSFRCNVYKMPDYGIKYTVEELKILEVKGDGKILMMSDGSIYEVNDLFTINTALWLGFSEALLIDDYELINLDEGGEIIEVIKIK